MQYVQSGFLSALESGGQVSPLLRPAVEYKTADFPITREVLKEQRQRLIEVILYKRVLIYACAAINARVNMIIYLGVRDDGTVVGVEIERELVGFFS